MDDLTPAERALVVASLRTMASLGAGPEVCNGLADRIAAVELTEAIHDIRARADKGVRDALVDQLRSILQAADTLSGCLGHCVALLAQIDEAREVEPPPLDGVVGSGREAVATWHQIKPAIEQGLAALDD